MLIFWLILIGVSAGVHAASYGAYKDSPYESFIPRRFVREVVIATGVGLAFALLGISDGVRGWVVWLAIFGLARIITEFFKLFIRVESQNRYIIPTQVHLAKRVVQNRIHRLGLGIVYLGMAPLVGLLAARMLPGVASSKRGLFAGFVIGLGEAIGGGYKDALFEGFEFLKFLRSPLLGALGGWLIGTSTPNLLLIVLGAIGFERLWVELYKAFIKPGYVPGKFKSREPAFPEWIKHRHVFVLPYVFSWIVLIILAFITVSS